MRTVARLVAGLSLLVAAILPAMAADAERTYKPRRGSPYVTTWHSYYVYVPYHHRPTQSFELYTGPRWRKRPATVAEVQCAELLERARTTRSDHWWAKYKRHC